MIDLDIWSTPDRHKPIPDVERKVRFGQSASRR